MTTASLSNGDAVKEQQPTSFESSPTGLKRKRAESEKTKEAQPSSHLFQDLQELLQKNDPSPSVLHLPLPNASRLTQTDGPSTKRPKLADNDSHNNIADRLQHNLYLTIDEFEHDLDDALDSLFEPFKAKDRLKNGQRMTDEDVASMQQLSQFRSLVKGCLERERTKDNTLPIKKEEEDPITNQSANTVLSLYGNAPQPRQLFSSLQQTDASIQGPGLSIEELGLPNMLSATKLVPQSADDARVERKSNPTFADLFAPPATLPQLNPPRPTKHSSSKSSTISWSQGELPKASRKAGYTLQPLTVGSWVGYGAVETKESASAIKRRRRESLLNGQEQPKPAEEASPADIIAQENALFRAAYSNFAPTQDNSKALVAKETKDMVWWHRLGERRFDEHFVLDPALQETPFPTDLEESAKRAAEEDAAAISGADDLEAIQKAIEEFDDEAFKSNNLDVVSTINEEEREVGQMLADISDLLKALSSHQRIRNSYIPTGSRNPASPSPLLSAMVGTSTAPSKEENETYRALRSQLAQLISQLPPYAVAKLDGEKFAELAVKKNIVIQGKEYRGTMEEDALSRMIRNTHTQALASANAGAQKTDSTPQYGRTPSVSNRSHASNYYNNATRTPIANFRGGAAQSYNNAPATAPRPSYPNTYNTTAAGRSSFSQTQYYPGGQRPTYASQYSAQTPQPSNPARPGFSVPQTAFAPRTTASTFANGTPAAGSYTPQTYGQGRSNYGATNTPVPAQQQTYQSRPQNYVSQPQPSSGRATPTFAQPQNPNTSSAVGPSGFHSTLTAEQQSLMMERQRAALAMQPQARMAAQTAPMGGSPAAPQAPTPNLPNGSA
ncbi:hypothetical protein D6C85_02518 [Aureobasidium pullulans]|uniref:Uncharacterized protein n=1 Tax=Aureobasidium pullulans TaxID=5580 RepID=A0A4S9XAB9_AURPU|nr:hypothetical protein D6D05_08583 [Aureobasidium pullulans]THZ76049.1 hypothetical protein D6C85_02518 [Aureobasidium pullulans]